MTMPATARPRPTLAGSSLRILELSLGQMLWSRRSIFLGLLTASPVVLAAVIRLVWLTAPASSLRINGASVSGTAIFGMMIWLMYIRFIVPVLGVFYGTALIADEVDDKTVTYLFTRPIPRGAVLFGKYLAYLACTTLLILPSIVVVYFLIVPLNGGSIGASFPALLADLGMVTLGLAGYGALFAAVGAWLKRPLLVGLAFAFGWEPGVLLFPGYLRQLTVAYYVQALVPHAMPDDGAINVLLQALQEMPSVPVSLVSLAAIIGVSLWVAARAVETREYVLEQ
ncbi:MAG: ABC transporter permease subunit [Luteitalea sp.]|nr:ABC transporter permease subunit [Luteitalea sp.]